MGHKVLMAVVRLSVRLSVPCLTLSREWKGVAGWKLTRSPWHSWHPVTRSKGQRSLGRLMLRRAMRHIFRTGGGVRGYIVAAAQLLFLSCTSTTHDTDMAFLSAVCLSVRPMLVMSKFFSSSGRALILVFFYRASALQNYDGNLFHSRLKTLHFFHKIFSSIPVYM